MRSRINHILEEASKTRELEAPRTEVGDNVHVRHESGVYKIDRSEQFPVSQIDKHQNPHGRNEHSKEEIEAIQARVRGIINAINQKQNE